ncbi:type I DNA topoisomerase [Patescibacteria group bacterium]|nr:type I DNA topoisomerase [Patescibacteria group bacterium]
MNLIIVESPVKAKTIGRFLGSKYKVLSSFGHVRDLPKRKLGVDVENDFKPEYIVPVKAKKTVSALKKAIKKDTKTILATDEDREGEAIAWHLKEVLGLENPERIVFHEITKSAIEEALKNPRIIDMNLVDAQQARRILDRIVGYKLSPFLWKKITKGLSAGRVQSVAVRLVVEKEKEIEKFIVQEYWTIEALLKKYGKEFNAVLIKKDNEPIEKLDINSKADAEKIVKDLENAEYKVIDVEKKEVKKNPLPPFTTSTLQQEAWKRLHYPARFTMRIAQELYEKGNITYHRTDSVKLSQISLTEAKSFIEEKYGKNYWAGYFRQYVSKGKTQEAHEAIRPTFAKNTPEKLGLEERHFKLYNLIWQRFVSCQMATAIFDATNIDIDANNYTFHATGQTLKFDGFLKVYPMKFEENELPPLKKEDILELIKLAPLQHFTEPPARYNEASLIKALEKHGIGRPSTYAPTLATIQDRNYVEKNEQKRFKPTEVGTIVNNLLVEHFPQIIDIEFTAKLEKELDQVADGKDTLIKTCRDFYVPFAKNLKEKYEEVLKSDITDKPTGKKCPKCGTPLVERLGRFGRFYACPKFPKCKYAESLEKDNLNIKCPKCNKGKITAKRTKKGKIFYGCNNFPECDFALWDKPILNDKNEPEKCPECGSLLVQKGKTIKCSNKECLYKTKGGEDTPS